MSRAGDSIAWFWNPGTPATPHPAVARIIAVDTRGASLGTGTLVAVSEHHGLVVTNWHVVRDARGTILVQFPDGFTSPATVLKVDREWDLAALAVWRPRAKPVAIAVDPPRPGDVLLIAGYGQGDYRVSYGPCTQYLAPNPGLPAELVELRAVARQGDSGGPIFNTRGELAGVLFGSGFGETMGAYCGRVRRFLYPLRETFLNLPPPDPLLVQANNLGPPGKGQPAAGTRQITSNPIGGLASPGEGQTAILATNPASLPLVAEQQGVAGVRPGTGPNGANSSVIAAQQPPTPGGSLPAYPGTVSSGSPSSTLASLSNDGQSWRPAAAQGPWQSGEADSPKTPISSSLSGSPASAAYSMPNPSRTNDSSFADAQKGTGGRRQHDGSSPRGNSPSSETWAQASEPSTGYSQGAPAWVQPGDFKAAGPSPTLTAGSENNQRSQPSGPARLTRPYESAWGSSGTDDLAFSHGRDHEGPVDSRDSTSDFGGSTPRSGLASEKYAPYGVPTTASISSGSDPKRGESNELSGSDRTAVADGSETFGETIGEDFSRRIPGSKDSTLLHGGQTERAYSPIPIYEGDDYQEFSSREGLSSFSSDPERDFWPRSDTGTTKGQERRPRDSRSPGEGSSGRLAGGPPSDGANSRHSGNSARAEYARSSHSGGDAPSAPKIHDTSAQGTTRTREGREYGDTSDFAAGELSRSNSTRRGDNSAHGELRDATKTGSSGSFTKGSTGSDFEQSGDGTWASGIRESGRPTAGNTRSGSAGSASGGVEGSGAARPENTTTPAGTAGNAAGAAESGRKENPGEKIAVGWETMIGVLGLLVLFVQSMRWLSLLYDRSYYRRRTYRTVRRRTAWTVPPPTAYRWYY